MKRLALVRTTRSNRGPRSAISNGSKSDIEKKKTNRHPEAVTALDTNMERAPSLSVAVGEFVVKLNLEQLLELGRALE